MSTVTTPGSSPWRASVKLNLSRSLVDKLHADIAGAVDTLEAKGPVSATERKLVKTSVTH
jgi:hypothetical protein